MLETVAVKKMDQLSHIYHLMKEKEDLFHADRLRDVIRKADQEEVVIAFCGHFSAGKSTMLNRLYGEELLPTSPIPTSANVVKIQSGADRVVLTMRSGKKYTYQGTFTDEELKQLCKNGDEVIHVQVYRENTWLPKGVALLDTPGIDSTDDDHRAATESSLHLADAIFYVMDYNHVLSEVNFQFVKELRERQKRVFLVVNQIDKHREEELSFPQYRKNVDQSFRDWGIQVEGVFYITLHQGNHPHNEWNQLQGCFQRLIQERKTVVEKSVSHEARYLVMEHVKVLEERKHKEVQNRLSSLAVDTLPDLRLLEEQRKKQEKRLNELKQKQEQSDETFQKGLEDILENAYLMPYEVRDLAHRYLETELTNFKVGFLFSRGKTEKEKERRQAAFYEKLKQTVDTQLDFHIKQYVIQYAKDQEVYTESLGEEIYHLHGLLKLDWLKEVIKEGAGFTGAYLLKYTEDLVQAIKQAYRREAQKWYHSFSEEIKARWNVQWKEEEDRLQRLEHQYILRKWMDDAEEEFQSWKCDLLDLLEGKKEPEPMKNPGWFREEKPVYLSEEELPLSGPTNSISSPHENERVKKERNGRVPDVEDRLSTVRRAEAVMTGLPALQTILQELKEKRRRGESRQFTIALFGAFSAGKSSFANALMGESVLPVSPNPTTATINWILPPNEEFRHGDGVIHFKSKETLLEDLKQVYHWFQRDIGTLEEGLQGIDKLLKTPHPTVRQKTTFPFLKALQSGFDLVQGHLGETILMKREEFEAYVAQESHSCFVERGELYFDCPLTRQGVTLVDTPGADSIHARHTDVAFQYIKNADAILFVTYYNHAFSRADREFLIQLGRVKDSFSMDKMFFIMNAADLASSQEERVEVEDYIRNQLLQYGIRQPRLFPVSSLLALEEKKAGDRRDYPDSGLSAFEDAFTDFLMKDLMAVSLHSMESDIRRAARVLENLLETARQSHEEKQYNWKINQKKQEKVLRGIREYDASLEEHALKQEVEELLYYVRQRLFLRYHDWFTEIFNPASLRDDRGDIPGQLRSCMLEMMDRMQHDLVQELRATSLRVEKWIRGKLDPHAELIQKSIHSYDPGLFLSMQVDFSSSSPEYDKPFPHLAVDDFKKVMSTFKNSKWFFERDGKKRFRDELKKVLDKEVIEYLRTQQDLLHLFYLGKWKQALDQVKEKAARDSRDYYKSIQLAWSEEVDTDEYEKKADQLKACLQEIHEQG
ncbi:GTPase [Kroppenstedtia pulmonis]|uniref:GTPase n=1 Tax=Kroppenstedtia pulmonis TaxID=1380685 RepID=A0A7D3Y529_9BACL|nr:dynamin family protein [Kroppenstedtia pulmonis]QKG84605.1 GTPase [Kroppenstedtia pulmonis]